MNFEENIDDSFERLEKSEDGYYLIVTERGLKKITPEIAKLFSVEEIKELYKKQVLSKEALNICKQASRIKAEFVATCSLFWYFIYLTIKKNNSKQILVDGKDEWKETKAFLERYSRKQHKDTETRLNELEQFCKNRKSNVFLPIFHKIKNQNGVSINEDPLLFKFETKKDTIFSHFSKDGLLEDTSISNLYEQIKKTIKWHYNRYYSLLNKSLELQFDGIEKSLEINIPPVKLSDIEVEMISLICDIIPDTELLQDINNTEHSLINGYWENIDFDKRKLLFKYIEILEEAQLIDRYLYTKDDDWKNDINEIKLQITRPQYYRAHKHFKELSRLFENYNRQHKNNYSFEEEKDNEEKEMNFELINKHLCNTIKQFEKNPRQESNQIKISWILYMK